MLALSVLFSPHVDDSVPEPFENIKDQDFDNTEQHFEEGKCP